MVQMRVYIKSWNSASFKEAHYAFIYMNNHGGNIGLTFFSVRYPQRNEFKILELFFWKIRNHL